MNWRHKRGLQRFARAVRSLDYYATPGIGEATWRALLENGWIEPVETTPGWRRRPYRLTEAGRAALQAAE